MRRLPLLLLLALSLSASYAQEPSNPPFPFALGGPGFDAANAVDADGVGTTVVGTFSETVDLDPGPDTFELTSAGGADGYLAYYRGDASVYWAFALGGDGFDAVFDVASGPAYHVHVTGAFSGTVDFDPGPGVFELTSTGAQAAFVAAYDFDGTFLWAFPLGAGDFDAGRAIAAYPTYEAVYVTGGFSGTSDFDPGPGVFNLTAARDQDAFVASYTLEGAFRWAFNLGSDAPQGATFDEGADLAVALEGQHVWVTGTFSNVVDFDPGPAEALVDSGIGFNDVFVARYTADGAYEWAFGVGNDRFDGGTAVSFDPQDNCYVTGFFNDGADFDPGPGEAVLTSVGGTQDAFVASYDAAGAYRWAFGLGSGAFENGNAVTFGLDPAAVNGVVVGGSFGETVDFDPGPGDALRIATAFDDWFVARYDSTGAFRWVAHGGAPETGNAVNGLREGEDDRILAVGFFEGTADFDPGPEEVLLTSSGLRDGFYLPLTDDGALPTAAEPGPDAPVGLALSAPVPNPARGAAHLVLTVPSAQPVTVAAYDALGRQVAVLHEGVLGAGMHALVLEGTALPASVYVVRATGTTGVAVRRVVLVR